MKNLPPLFVARPYLPDLEEFLPYLEKIWESRNLTNGAYFHQQLELEIGKLISNQNLSLVANGTIGLLLALKALDIKGEVITTPFSFVATAHSIIWANCKPVFIDIDPKTLNMDPSKIEKAISKNTSAILAVHCYGVPCDVFEIQRIATRHNLKVIYDAAHAFGGKAGDKSILNYGDISVVSFHATKIFHTFEGGLITSQSPELKQKVDRLKNFGLESETSIFESGINGKMNEISAAMGLLQLRKIGSVFSRRSALASLYIEKLERTNGIVPTFACFSENSNHSYFPVIVSEKFRLNRDQLLDELKKSGIHCRRYFFPLISDFDFYKKSGNSITLETEVAEDVARKIICLPIFTEMTSLEVERVCTAIHDLS